MIALDSSANVAIACAEPEEELFNRLIVVRRAVVGAPTLVEVRLVLEDKLEDEAGAFLAGFVRNPYIEIAAFGPEMLAEACSAFDRYGKGRGHPARLNFGDCLAYAVAKTQDLPLLYKGNDFALTDIRRAR